MDRSFYAEIGRRIADLRRARQLSQESLAEAAGIAASYVAHIETGGRKPTLDVLGGLAAALGVPLVHLIGGDKAAGGTSGGPADALTAEAGGLTGDEIRLLVELARRIKGTRPTPASSGRRQAAGSRVTRRSRGTDPTPAAASRKRRSPRKRRS